MYTLNDFNYTLPDALIAQFPAKNRTESRLLIASADSDELIHTQFPAFLDYINENDLIIFNDTRVMNARLFGNKISGGKIECLIERVLNDHQALAHIRASITPKIGIEIIFENVLHAKVIARDNAFFILEFLNQETITELLEKHGHLPLPPYISRDVKREDLERYQTIYAEKLGAVAAPTAGLHFDENIISQLKNKKIEMGFVTLHVGAGTFQPVRVDDLSQHKMHHEFFTVAEKLCKQICAARERGGRIIAIGTTVVRALESAGISGEIKPFSGETNIFITPGFEFKMVDVLLTNFHLPKSTLLMLVSAFAGFDKIKLIYQNAVEEKYRFFSYGDAMLLEKKSL
ncbi:MAG TPA: tRNA preQ1(34) S-adenosylmethionine ribosyltransferase-isomerase QueA [Coxiellaceae bacterium]|nr:MAG: tRNA preQ1(34) S-adenosylmethionine ribosyltransferase-isomerase QueA [Gammaproteobacteria bacterium RIFCSPHIGHO2_12_FULL_36_30]HLB56839.1 tRNA preQ1(34) S-adenosylmethionine ribosyltransferase-isomerase QueA [Coxiellaceae bacterium]